MCWHLQRLGEELPGEQRAEWREVREGARTDGGGASSASFPIGPELGEE